MLFRASPTIRGLHPLPLDPSLLGRGEDREGIALLSHSCRVQRGRCLVFANRSPVACWAAGASRQASPALRDPSGFQALLLAGVGHLLEVELDPARVVVAELVLQILNDACLQRAG